MSSALKPAMPQGGAGQGGNSLNHSQGHNQMIGQNMSHISANMGHVGNAHPTQNSTHSPGALNAVSPSKGGNHTSPLSLVQDKVQNASQPTPLTRSPEKEAEVGKPTQVQTQSNGTGEVTLDKPQCNSEPISQPQPSSTADKPQESSTFPVEEKVSTGETEKANADIPKVNLKDVSLNSETLCPDKSSLPSESNACLPTEESVSDKKKEPESKEASKASSQCASEPENEKPKSPAKQADGEKAELPVDAVSPVKADSSTAETSKPEESPVEDEKKIANENTKPVQKVDEPSVSESKPEETKPAAEEPPKPSETPSEASPTKDSNPLTVPLTPINKKTEVKPKSTLKLATVTPTLSRKRKKDVKMPLQAGSSDTSPSPPKRTPVRREKIKDGGGLTEDIPSSIEDDLTPDSRLGKRNRTKVQPYQVPTPELAMLTKLSVTQAGRTTPTKNNDEKLIVFYKNEFLAVRNAEGGFYVCQTMQNVYRTTRKIKIRWLSQEKTADPSGEIYKPDFYDVTDMECVLTTLSLQRSGAAGLRLGAAELARTQSILGRALAAERGEPTPDTSVTEEHPDGLDLSLYKDESQLDKKKQKQSSPSRKRTHSKSHQPETPAKVSKAEEAKAEGLTPSKAAGKSKRSAPTPKKSPAKKAKGKTPKQKSQPPTPAASTSKTATTPAKATPTTSKVTPKKGQAKSTPAKTNNVTPSTSKAKTTKTTPAKAAAAAKAAQLASTPSTSTGKATRTPRKPPSKK